MLLTDFLNRRDFVRLEYLDDNRQAQLTSDVIDSITHEADGEYVLFKNYDKVRLDRIISINDILLAMQ
jgi:hypothetical protein